MTVREDALLQLRAERDRLDKRSEELRLRRQKLNDLMLDLATGKVSAKEALEKVKS